MITYSDPWYELAPGDEQPGGLWLVPFPQLRHRQHGAEVPVVVAGHHQHGTVVGHDLEGYPLIRMGGAA